MADDVYVNLVATDYQIGKFKFRSGVLRLSDEVDKNVFERLLPQIPLPDRNYIQKVDDGVFSFPPDWILRLDLLFAEIASQGPAAQQTARDNLGITAGGGGVTDGNKGDITVSVGGTVWTINPSALAAYLTQAAGDLRYSQLGHTHTQAEVAGLVAALAAKANVSQVRQEVFVQTTRPATAGPWVWWKKDAQGNIVDLTINDGL